MTTKPGLWKIFKGILDTDIEDNNNHGVKGKK